MEFTEEELKALAELKSRITDLRLDDYHWQNFSLINWLHATELDSSKAEQMIRKSYEWRKQNGLPTEITTWSPPPFYHKYFPYCLGYDKEGLPVGIIPGVAWDAYVRKELAAGRKTTIHRYIIQIMNKIEMDMVSMFANENKVVTNFRVIFDLKGFGLRHLTSIGVSDVTMEVLKIYEHSYPDTLKSAHVINAPKLFTFLFEIVRRVMSSKTASLLEVYDSNEEKWKAALLQHIDPEQLPVTYGGTREDFTNAEASPEADTAREQLLTQEMTIATIKSGQKLSLPFEIDTVNQKLSWIFKTVNYDIGFSITYNDEEEVFPKYRVESHRQVEEGSLVCKKLGKYTVIFDNSYSIIRAKTLHYFIVVEDA